MQLIEIMRVFIVILIKKAKKVGGYLFKGYYLCFYPLYIAN